MRTPFEPENQARSDRAHLLAREIFYPRLFKTTDLIYVDATNSGSEERSFILDREMGVDRVIGVKVQGYRQEIIHTIQERFRSPEFAWNRDLTITEWNELTDQPSELFKITSGWFVYGYHNADFTDFVDIVAMCVTEFLYALPWLPCERRTNRKQQVFCIYRFEDLEECGLLTRVDPWTDRRWRNAP